MTRSAFTRSTLLGLACGALIMAMGSAAAHPFRGSVRWSVLLCDFTDSPPPPRTVAYYQDLFVNRGTGGLADFYADISRGSVVMSASDVRGWFRIPKTAAQTRMFSHGGPGGNRGLAFQDCIDAARAGGYTMPAGNLVAIVTNPGVDLFGWPGRGAYLSVDHDLGAFGHEVLHGFGLNHSFADRPVPATAAPFSHAEYGDPFDTMSWAVTYGTAPGRFGSTGPGFNAYHLDRMGWLARNELVNFGADGATSTLYTLTPLYAPGVGGGMSACSLTLMIPTATTRSNSVNQQGGTRGSLTRKSLSATSSGSRASR